MGRTQTYYYVQNTGLDRAQLQEIMNRAFAEEEPGNYADKLVDRLVKGWGEGIREKAEGWAAEYRAFLQSDAYKAWQKDYEQHRYAYRTSPPLPSPVLAYRPDARWLPFFDEELCECYTASSKDARKLSKTFGAPVLALSIFDDDILMLSYSDAARRVKYDYGKPNCEGMEEYDKKTFSRELPVFLLELYPALTTEKLTEIWEGDESFAGDRLQKLEEMLGLSPLDMELPSGFEAITTAQQQ